MGEGSTALGVTVSLRYAYIGRDGKALASLTLLQSPADSRFFELGQDVDRRQNESPDMIEWLNPGDLRLRRGRPRTDLASVPPFLWSLTATYGRQTLPALFHDRDADRAYAKAKSSAWKDGWEDRRKADDEFYGGLRSNRVPVVRSWIMWAAVRLQAYWSHHRRWALAVMVFHVAVVVAILVIGTVSVVKSMAQDGRVLVASRLGTVSRRPGRDAERGTLGT